jgi:hypothetical protein
MYSTIASISPRIAAAHPTRVNAPARFQVEGESRTLLRGCTLAARARQAAAASAQILKAGNTTGRGSKTANVPSKTVTLAKKARIAKRALSPFGVLREGLWKSSVRRIGPCCGYYQSDIAATWLPEGPGLMTA